MSHPRRLAISGAIARNYGTEVDLTPKRKPSKHIFLGGNSNQMNTKDSLDMNSIQHALPNGASPGQTGASPKPMSASLATGRSPHQSPQYMYGTTAMPSPPKSSNGMRINVPSPAPQAGPPNYHTLPAIERSHRFVITGTLQQSLFGVVKLAFDRELKKQVAIKISRRELSSKQHTRTGVSVLENVKREASIMKYLLTRKEMEEGESNKQETMSGTSVNTASTSQIDSDSMCDEPEDQRISTAASITRGSECLTPSTTANTNHTRSSSSYGRPHHDEEENGSRYIAHMICEMEDEYFHYLVTEFVPAGDLYSMLTSYPQHRLSESQAKYFFRQVVKGMKYLHDRNVAHLDLSLENVCLDVDPVTGVESCRLIDFGVAALHPWTPIEWSCEYSQYASSTTLMTGSLPSRSLNSSNNNGVASSSFLCKPVSDLSNKPGKLRYMSHELLCSQQWDAYKNDIFALGVILYSLLTGRPPFSQADSSDVWFNVIYSGQWLTEAIMNQPAAHVYTHLSKEARSLIDDIIKPQGKRPNCEMILNHPWLQMKD